MKTFRFHVLAGPTAVGKSEFAVEVAERLGTEIVGADAFQVYQGFQILSAKPTPALQARVRHHLIDVLPIVENCDAARYAALAGEEIRELNRRGVVPLLVGGSGFYIDALLNPLPDLPGSDPELRNSLAKEPLESLLSELKDRDPQAYQQIDQHNRRRVERAIEVIRLTGKPFSSHRRPKTRDGQFPGLVLTRPVLELNQRIDRRVGWMLDNGAIQEVAMAGELSTTASQMIGVSEINCLLRQEISLEECTQLIQTATRQYAKRQRTWFRVRSFVEFPAAGSVEDAVEFFRKDGQ